MKIGGPSGMAYDDEGRTLTRTDSSSFWQTYHWNDRSQIDSVTTIDGGDTTVVRYTYDGLGRRISRYGPALPCRTPGRALSAADPSNQFSGMDSPAAGLGHYFQQASVPGLVSAYLFGSVARGAAHRESDVDVGVLLDRSKHSDRTSRNALRIDLTSALVHVLGRNNADVVILNDAPPELGRSVVKQGSRVYCADAEADHAFVRDVQLRAADLDPFLRRMRRIKAEALRE